MNDITKTYNQHVAVDELSFTIREHECVALIGPNGSGKTTTLNMLAGLLAPTSGKLSFLGKPSMDRQEIGFLPQYPNFYSWMTAREFLHFAGKLSNVSSKQLKSKVDDMLAFVGLEDAKNQRIGGFSGGMKQRLGLAQALLHDPKLLILDEPVSALDPTGRRDVLLIMKQLKKELTILFSTHVLHDAEQVCDSIVMIKDGKLRWSGPLESLKNKERATKYVLATEEKLEPWLRSKTYVTHFDLHTPSSAELTLESEQDRHRLLKDCIHDGLDVTHFEMKKHSLEDAYLEVMNE